MNQIIMLACKLLVLCLINLAVGCKSKVDKNSNLIPYDDIGQNDFDDIPIVQPTNGGNGQYDFYQDLDTRKPQKYWDYTANCPYTGHSSGSGVYDGPNYYEDSYNSGVADNGRWNSYTKVQAYPADGYYDGETYNAGYPRNNYNYYNPYSPSYSYYEKDKPYTSGGYYPVNGGKTGLYPSYYDYGERDKGRWSIYTKGKQYNPDGYYPRDGYDYNLRENNKKEDLSSPICTQCPPNQDDNTYSKIPSSIFDFGSG